MKHNNHTLSLYGKDTQEFVLELFELMDKHNVKVVSTDDYDNEGNGFSTCKFETKSNQKIGLQELYFIIE